MNPTTSAEPASAPIVRKLAADDVAGIAAIGRLFRANSRENVADPARDGFVQGNLRPEIIRPMAALDGVWVAEIGGEIVGFVCSADSAAAGPPPVAEIQRRAGELRFAGRPLADQRWMMYGPVVIDPAHRGAGLLRGLFSAVKLAWRGRATTGVSFVEEVNQRSMNAHIRGLGMTPIGRFDIDGRGYAVLAFDIPAAS